MSDLQNPSWQGLLLRVGLFAVIGYGSMLAIPFVIFALAGPVLTATLTSFGASAIANAITVRVYERGRLVDVGLGSSATSKREFFLGGGMAMLAAASVTGLPVVVRMADFVPVPAPDHGAASFLYTSVMLLFGAMGEEMLFHGYAFQLLVRRIGPWATILPMGVLFGVAHSGNVNATLGGILNTILWGVLLGYAYVRTGALWLPIGLHFGWNFTLPLFGVNLSGFTMGVTGYALSWKVGAFWSGGAYGPEGGILTTLAAIALFFALPKLFPEAATESLAIESLTIEK